MQLIESAVGRKIVMAITGLILVGFIVVHMLGNTTIFFGPDGINAYAKHLRDLSFLLWPARAVLLATFLIHIYFGITLTLENRAARPEKYKRQKMIRSSLGGRTAIWSGLLVLAFVVYHLLHFTFQVTNPEISAHHGLALDAMGRPDIFTMVVSSFQIVPIALVYIAAMVALLFHVSHGIQSLVQTLGINTDRTLPYMEKFSTVAAVVVQIGFIAIPVSVLVKLIGS